MKCISLYQPYASLVAYGLKKFETRSWSTNYRGPLAIAAIKAFPEDLFQLCFEAPFHKLLEEMDRQKSVLDQQYLVTADGLPRGAVVAVCTLTNVYDTDDVTELWVEGSDEEAFGDYSPGRFAWKLEDVRRLDPPIPVRGRQGLWNWDEAGLKDGGLKDGRL